MLTRIVTALIALPVVIFLVQSGGWPFLVTLFLIAIIASREFVLMMSIRGHKPSLWFTLSIVIVAMTAIQYPQIPLFMPGFMGLMIVGLIWELCRANDEASPVNWALAVAGGAYIGIGLSHFIGLRLLPDGHILVWLVLLSTWGADSFAYFGGRAFGRHQFWPRWSPKKTWEGFVSGIFGGAFGGWLVVAFFGFPLGQALIIGFLASLVGPFGDLSISMMKRYTGVKDSSHLIPGHGGMLDRIDSLLFTTVVIFYYVIWAVR